MSQKQDQLLVLQVEKSQLLKAEHTTWRWRTFSWAVVFLILVTLVFPFFFLIFLYQYFYLTSLKVSLSTIFLSITRTFNFSNWSPFFRGCFLYNIPVNKDHNKGVVVDLAVLCFCFHTLSICCWLFGALTAVGVVLPLSQRCEEWVTWPSCPMPINTDQGCH